VNATSLGNQKTTSRRKSAANRGKKMGAEIKWVGKSATKPEGVNVGWGHRTLSDRRVGRKQVGGGITKVTEVSIRGGANPDGEGRCVFKTSTGGKKNRVHAARVDHVTALKVLTAVPTLGHNLPS